MKITRIQAVAIFVALGFKIADKWDDARLNKRLSQMGDNVDEEAIKNIEDEAVRKDAKACVKALADGETVELEAAEKPAKAEKAPKAEKPAKVEKTEDDEGTPAEKPAKPEKAPKVEKTEGDEKPAKAEKAPKVDKAKKTEAAVDKFGNRVGSQAANINAALAKKWTTVADVAKTTKLSEARVRSHFKYLEGKKIAEYDAEKGARLL